jgi:hypothetical protein
MGVWQSAKHLNRPFGASFWVDKLPGLIRKTKKPPKTAWAGNQVVTS